MSARPYPQTAPKSGSKAGSKKNAAKPPAGTAADANLFKAAGVALAVPTLPTFVGRGLHSSVLGRESNECE
jgi:hypothetical protein